MQMPKSITWPNTSCRRPSKPFRETMQDGVIMLRLCHNPEKVNKTYDNPKLYQQKIFTSHSTLLMCYADTSGNTSLIL